MRATFSGFMTAQYALSTSQNSLNVVGQNIANINTVGYTKQQADQISLNLTNPDNKFNIGYGSLTTGVSQLRDPYLDLRFRTEIANVGEADVVYSTLTELESIFDEIANIGVQEALTDLMSALQDLSLNISSDEFQEMIKGSADSLAQLITQYSSQLETIRNDSLDSLESVDIENVNNILQNIATLSASIEKNELLGGDSLELKDERNLLLDELASYMNLDIKYVGTEVQPGVTIERLQITFSQKTYDEYGNSESETITILNGSYAGSFGLDVNSEGQYGITFTSGIGDALNDAEGISKLNNAISSLGAVNNKLNEIADEIAIYDAMTDAEKAKNQQMISDLINSRDDYYGMRDNFLNTIEAMVDIEYTIDPDTGVVLTQDGEQEGITFCPTQTIIYDSTLVEGLPMDGTDAGGISSTIFEIIDDALYYGTNLIGDVAELGVTEDEVEMLNNYISNLGVLYDQLDDVKAQIDTYYNDYSGYAYTDINGDTITTTATDGIIPFTESLIADALQSLLAQDAVVKSAEADVEEAEAALEEHLESVSSLYASIATKTATIAAAKEAGDDPVYIAELEAELAELQDEYDNYDETTKELNQAIIDAQEVLATEVEYFGDLATYRDKLNTNLATYETEYANLFEEQVGLLEQRDDFMLKMDTIVDLTYNTITDPDDDNYGKLTDITFTTAVLDPDDTPDVIDIDLNYSSDDTALPPFSIDSTGNILLNGEDIQLSLTTDFLVFTSGSFKGSLDTLNCAGEDGSLRGIAYYEKQLDELVMTFADLFNDINTNKSAGYNVGEVNAIGEALQEVLDDAGNPYFAVTGDDGKPLYFDSATMTLGADEIVDADGRIYTKDTNYSVSYSYDTNNDGNADTTVNYTIGEQYYLSDNSIEVLYGTGGTGQVGSGTIEAGEFVNRTGIPQYNDDGTPLLDEAGNHIFHDEALQLDADGNNVGNNFLFTYDPADPSGTFTIAQGWLNGEYKMTTSTIPDSASGANDTILELIDALSSDQNFSITTSDPPFNSGDKITSFDGTFYEFFSNICTTLGLDIKTTASTLTNSVTLVSDIADSRNSYSGVNLDEEGISLLQYQKSYNAAAKLMTILDTMVETVIGMVR